MFTGIITDIGSIKAIEPRGDLRVVIATAYDTAGLAIGAANPVEIGLSIAAELTAAWRGVLPPRG